MFKLYIFTLKSIEEVDKIVDTVSIIVLLLFLRVLILLQTLFDFF